MTIEKRLENMEKELGRVKRLNRWLLGAILLVGGGTVIPALLETTAFRAGAQAAFTLPEIRANKFVLEDKSGKARAGLYLMQEGPTLTLLDENGQPRAWLALREFGPDLALIDKNSELRASLSVSEDGPRFSLNNENGDSLSRLTADKDGSRLTMYDGTQQFSSTISASESGALMSVAHGRGEKAITLLAHKDGLDFEFSDDILSPRASMKLSKEGPSLELFDEKGMARFIAGRTATVTQDGKTITFPESSLILFGPDSKVIWSAIK